MIVKKIITFGLATSVALATASFASANAPERPDRADLTEIIESFREAQQELVQERRDLAASLRDKTVEERRQAIEDYQAENADRIALHRALSEQMRELMQAARPEVEHAGADRPEIPAAQRAKIAEDVRGLMDEFRATREALIQDRLELLAALRDATDEERAAALAELREQNAENAAQQRQLADEIRDAVQDIREDRRNN